MPQIEVELTQREVDELLAAPVLRPFGAALVEPDLRTAVDKLRDALLAAR